MRALFTTTGYPGHVLPLIPFAHAWQRAGHETCVAGPRSRGSLVQAAALEFVELAEPADHEMKRVVTRAAELPRAQGHAHMMSEGFARVATRAVLPGLLQLVGAWRPDVVVRESHEFAGALAAERHGTLDVRVALGLGSTEAQLASLATGAIDELRSEFGLAADPRAERLRASPSLTFVPPALEQPNGGEALHAYRFRERAAAPAPLPDWWSGRRGPLVYVTLGSIAGSLGFFPGLYRAVLEALGELPVRVLVTTGEGSNPDDLGPLPANVHAEAWVAQERALSGAAAVICHGGYGSTLGSLSRGLPLAIVPLFGDDQWHNARRVAEIGAGIVLDGGDDRLFLDQPASHVTAALGRAVEQLLQDGRYKRAAAQVAGDVEALPPVDSAAGVLAKLTRQAIDTRQGGLS